MKKPDAAFPILYRLAPFDPAGHRYRITLTIDTPSPEGQRLSLPAWIPGSYLIRDFSRQIESLSAHAGTRRVNVDKIDNHTWQAAPCDGPLRVEYEVYAWDLSVRGAHLDDSHGFFNGTSVFLRVHGQDHLPCLLDLAPPRGLDGWKVYTSLPEARGHRGAARRHGFGLYLAPDYDALIDHPVEMGTPHVATFTAHGAEHELVFTGVTPNLDLARITGDVKKICETQIEFFEPRTKRAPFLDSTDRYVFMTMVTGDGYGGLEHRASTALMTSRKDLPVVGQQGQGEGYRGFLGLVSHEYFHTWNVKRIKPQAFAPYHLDQPDLTRLLWVFEGFTSYYDDLLLLRSGAITQSDYLRLLAKTITSVARTPGRAKQSVAESSFDAWTRYYKQDENSPNALVSYYTKGALVALGLVLLTGVGGLTSFGQAAFVGVGAYTTALLTTRADTLPSWLAWLGASPWLTLLAGLLLTLVIAYLLGAITLKLSGHFLPLGTIAWGLSLYFAFGSVEGLGGHTGIPDIPAINLFGWTLNQGGSIYYLIWAFLMVAVWSTQNLLDSREGRAIRALKGGRVMAESMGVNTARSRMVIFIIAAL